MVLKSEDRRIQRTRTALHDALIELILEKGYEAITIQDIIDQANVGRSTFYAHYLDKQQLLLASIAGLRTILIEQQAAAIHVHGGLAKGTFAFSYGMFDHAASHAQLYRAMVGKQSGTIIQRELQQILASIARDEIMTIIPTRANTPIPVDVIVEYVVNAYTGLLTWWLEARLPCSTSEIDQMFQTLTIPGVNAAVGR